MKYITIFVRSSDTHDSNFRIVTHYVRLSINKQVNHNSCHQRIVVANSLEPDQAQQNTRPRGYKTFSCPTTEHKISSAHKNLSTDK